MSHEGYKKINASGVGNQTLIAAPGPGFRIEIYAMFFQCSSATTCTLRSGTTAQGDLTGPMSFLASGGFNLAWTGFPLYTLNENEPLTALLAGLTPSFGGGVIYDIVPV